jgi:hypothetical protein
MTTHHNNGKQRESKTSHSTFYLLRLPRPPNASASKRKQQHCHHPTPFLSVICISIFCTGTGSTDHYKYSIVRIVSTYIAAGSRKVKIQIDSIFIYHINSKSKRRKSIRYFEFQEVNYSDRATSNEQQAKQHSILLSKINSILHISKCNPSPKCFEDLLHHLHHLHHHHSQYNRNHTIHIITIPQHEN